MRGARLILMSGDGGRRGAVGQDMLCGLRGLKSVLVVGRKLRTICALDAEFGRWDIGSWQRNARRHLAVLFEKTLLWLVTRTCVRSGIHGCIIVRRYRVALLLWDLESLVVLSCYCCCLRCAIRLSFAYTGCLLD